MDEGGASGVGIASAVLIDGVMTWVESLGGRTVVMSSMEAGRDVGGGAGVGAGESTGSRVIFSILSLQIMSNAGRVDGVCLSNHILL